MAEEIQKLEHRKYPRLHRTFPLRFQYLDEAGKPYGETFKGFARNVGKGGISIEIEHERGASTLELIPDKTKLKLAVNIPQDAPPLDSIVTVKWATKISEPVVDVYFFGVEYDRMDNAQQLMIERYVKRLHRNPRLFVYFLLLFAALAIVFTYMLFIAR